MKTAIALLAVGLLFALSGCRTGQTTNKSDATPKVAPTEDDTSEVLIQHLMWRVRDLTSEVEKREHEIGDHDLKCVEEQIAVLEGRPVHHAKQDPVEDARALGEKLSASFSRLSQNVLDGEAAIEEHNRKHPESPWADSKDLLRQICGDCTKERTIRDAQLNEEAQKYAQ